MFETTTQNCVPTTDLEPLLQNIKISYHETYFLKQCKDQCI